MGVTEFYDGFDYPNVENLRWDSVSSIQTTDPGRYGGTAISLRSSNAILLLSAGTNGYGRGLLSQSATKTIGFALIIHDNMGTDPICHVLDGGTDQCDLRFDSSGHIIITRNGTAIATSTSALLINTWYYIEWTITIHPSAGSTVVTVNTNNTYINATGLNTRNTANSWINGMYFIGNTAGSGSHDTGLDDVYIRNDNLQLGECRCILDDPNADGDTTQFTPNSGANHFSRLTGYDGDTSYVWDTNIGDLDLVKYPTYSSGGGQTQAVQMLFAARKDDSGVRAITPAMKTHSTVYDGPSTGTLPTSYLFWAWMQENNPNTGIGWTDAEVTALQLGAKVAA